MADGAPADRAEPDIVRSVIAVMGGVLLYYMIAMALETVLVGAASETPPADMAAYFAIRNRPAILGTVVVSSAIGALLSGFVTARTAGSQEFGHVGVLAAIETALLAWAFTMGELASSTPVWARVALVATTAPAMLLGATVRMRARVAAARTSVPSKEPQ